MRQDLEFLLPLNHQIGGFDHQEQYFSFLFKVVLSFCTFMSAQHLQFKCSCSQSSKGFDSFLKISFVEFP